MGELVHHGEPLFEVARIEGEFGFGLIAEVLRPELVDVGEGVVFAAGRCCIHPKGAGQIDGAQLSEGIFFTAVEAGAQIFTDGEHFGGGHCFFQRFGRQQQTFIRDAPEGWHAIHPGGDAVAKSAVPIGGFDLIIELIRPVDVDKLQQRFVFIGGGKLRSSPDRPVGQNSSKSAAVFLDVGLG